MRRCNLSDPDICAVVEQMSLILDCHTLHGKLSSRRAGASEVVTRNNLEPYTTQNSAGADETYACRCLTVNQSHTHPAVRIESSQGKLRCLSATDGTRSPEAAIADMQALIFILIFFKFVSECQTAGQIPNLIEYNNRIDMLRQKGRNPVTQEAFE